MTHSGPEDRASAAEPDDVPDDVPDELVQAAREELENPADETDEG